MIIPESQKHPEHVRVCSDPSMTRMTKYPSVQQSRKIDVKKTYLHTYYEAIYFKTYLRGW